MVVAPAPPCRRTHGGVALSLRCSAAATFALTLRGVTGVRALCVLPVVQWRRVRGRPPSRDSRGAADYGIALAIVAPAPSRCRAHVGVALGRRGSAAAALAFGSARRRGSATFSCRGGCASRSAMSAAAPRRRRSASSRSSRGARCASARGCARAHLGSPIRPCAPARLNSSILGPAVQRTSKPSEGEVPPAGCAGVVCANEANKKKTKWCAFSLLWIAGERGSSHKI